MKGSKRHVAPDKPQRKGRHSGTPKLVRRQRVIDKTMGKFAGHEFKLGGSDCWKLVRFYLKQLGHELPGSGKAYSTPAEALAALKSKKCRNLADVMDLFLQRIPPASMLLGDVALLLPEKEGDTGHELGTLMIHLGTTKFLGWHPDASILAVVDIVDPKAVQKAWRA